MENRSSMSCCGLNEKKRDSEPSSCRKKAWRLDLEVGGHPEVTHDANVARGRQPINSLLSLEFVYRYISSL